jgi:hypothetical protein
LLHIGALIYDVLKRLYNRRDYRFPVKIESCFIDSSGKTVTGTINDISSGGVGIVIHDTAPIQRTITLNLGLPDGMLQVSGHVTYHKNIGPDRMLGIRFGELPLETKRRLYLFLFVTIPRSLYDGEKVLKLKRKLSRYSCQVRIQIILPLQTGKPSIFIGGFPVSSCKTDGKICIIK